LFNAITKVSKKDVYRIKDAKINANIKIYS